MSSGETGEGLEWSELHDFVSQQLKKRDTSFKGRTAARTQRFGGYHEAAAVLSSFEVNRIKPTSSADGPGTLESLLSDSTVVYDDPTHLSSPTIQTALQPDTGAVALRDALSANRPRWTLLPQVRRKVIEQLGSPEAMLEALASNPDRPVDPLQKMIEAYLNGDTPPMAARTITQLTCTAQIIEWFGGILKNLPDGEEVDNRLEAKRFLEPFEKLVGQHFSGRDEQLTQLYQYVGVLPTTLWDGVKRSAKEFLNFHQKPPLMIYGPGGVGKSTLIAKFILDHATLDRTRRFPYAYLDFDRPGLLAEEPVTLLVEAIRQLGIQYPDVREYCDRVRKGWQEKLSFAARQAESTTSDLAPSAVPRLQPQERTSFLQDFDALLGSIGLRDDPFLLVLDTFEEVQYRSREFIGLLWDFLNEFQSIVPRLRTVLSGRARIGGNDSDEPVEGEKIEEPIESYKIEKLKLGDLDEGAAQGFLTAQKVKPTSLVNLIVTRVGGSPLSLNLAVDVFFKEKDKGNPEAFFEQLKKDRIQSQLYTRILKHIHTDEVRQLAHPGLVLRRITPGLILDVLSKPCGVKVDNKEQAEKLFEDLSREFTLVVPAAGALKHMPEVRKGMIELLRADDEQKDKIREIQEGAIKYYEVCEDPVSRAEEIYHRLVLGQDHAVVAGRWMTGVERFLHNAVEELAAPEQAFLAPRLQINLDDSILDKATQEDWEYAIAQRVNDLLRLRQPEKALEALGRRSQRLTGSSLYLLEAQALEQRGDLTAALEIVERGLSSDAAPQTRDLLLLGARIERRVGRYEGARLKLMRAQSLIDPSEDGGDTRLLEIMLELVALEMRNPTGVEVIEQLRQETQALLERISDAQLVEKLSLLRTAAGLFPENSGVMLRTVRLVGLEAATPTQLRALARVIADWELVVSSISNSEPGVIARAVRVPVRGSVVDTWLAFIETPSPGQLRETVVNLLGQFKAPPQVLNALAGILSLPDQDEPLPEAGGGGPEGVSSTSNADVSESERPSGRTDLKITPEQRRDFLYALTQAFPDRAALAQMLRYRLDWNLDSISLTDDLSNAVYNLVSYAEQRGALAQLLAAARESRPSDVRLANLGRQFGLAAETTDKSDSLEKIIESRITLPIDWRATLGEMEGRICRVDVDIPGGANSGTGFLVGPDILMTAFTVVQPVVAGQIDPQELSLRFDYKQLFDGTIVNPGTVYRLAKNGWLIDYSDGGQTTGESTQPGLNYALLRLEGVPGREPIGGDKAEPGAPTRGWINIGTASSFTPVGQWLMLHHEQGGSLKISLGSEDDISLGTGGDRVNYRLSMEPGPAGAPFFNMNWEFIALMEGKRKTGRIRSVWHGVGVPAFAILERLERLGFATLLGGSRFRTMRLRTGRIFLNRSALRQALADLSSSHGRRILVVNGPRGSGKTYTYEFIKELAYDTPDSRVIYVNPGTLPDPGPSSLARVIGQEAGLDIATMPTPEGESDERLARALVEWLRSAARAARAANWWVVIDDCSETFPQATIRFVERLQVQAAETGSRLRVVLLNYTLPMPGIVTNFVIREDIAPLQLEDVRFFLDQTFPGMEQQKIDEVMMEAKILIEGEERSSETLNAMLSELLRKFS